MLLLVLLLLLLMMMLVLLLSLMLSLMRADLMHVRARVSWTSSALTVSSSWTGVGRRCRGQSVGGRSTGVMAATLLWMMDLGPI